MSPPKYKELEEAEKALDDFERQSPKGNATFYSATFRFFWYPTSIKMRRIIEQAEQRGKEKK